ncbi:PEP-CTERM protein-sorting domain-containing protein/MYXO-CTERM domain-containing protein [Rubritalea squalenifaciens DSM 18772]|uniref:PEP-CTERM protein-sorting domain-containing protein/MYXO-CTERM domain-containing protein n=1 Tax=Rubritalea squalenifaciens DSM 18772 TaxID=1123071 RepID=A0A1M6LHI5_9BACT|nr:PEP-CTERM sorting domain-containing protein [Rubritalea squalenifaciens]SHJ70637.1 PEP-CTERM protein-sorting domain-containing protein/MYXO-CTERM domain-containing protein [Rubritalea squalenifaciens DSM 18772]
MKTPITLITLASLSTLGHAATISLDAGGNAGDSAVSSGSISSIVGSVDSDSVADGPGPQTLTYTIDGLDIDGIGGTNDQLVVSVVLSTGDAGHELETNQAAGGNWIAVDSLINTNSAQTNYIDQTNEVLIFSLGSATANLNGGSDNGTVNFIGFTGGQVLNYDGGTISINGSSFGNTDIDGSQEFTLGSASSTLSYGFTSGDEDYRVEMGTLEFDVTAVPEPSSTSLLGLAGLGLILRRRRA